MKLTETKLKQIIFEEVVDRLIEIEAQKFRIALREEFAKEGILLTEAQEDEEIEEGTVCEGCGKVHEGGCGHHVPTEDDMFDSTEGDGDFFDDEEDGFNQDEVQFGGFGESKEKTEKELIAEDIKKMKQIIKPISKI